MNDLNVRIETLPGMHMASVRGFGTSPELEAWQKLRDWSKQRGLRTDDPEHPIYGFNNPAPQPEREEYGYELWMRVDETGAGPDFKEFEGGTYAVTGCNLMGEPGIENTWRMLWDWVQASPYTWRHTHELEKLLNPDASVEEMMVELYLPVSIG